MFRRSLVFSLLLACGPATPGSTDTSTSSESSSSTSETGSLPTSTTPTSETGELPTSTSTSTSPTSETGDLPGLVGVYHDDSRAVGDKNLPTQDTGPAIFWGTVNLDIRADGTLVAEVFYCESPKLFEYTWEPIGGGPELRVLPKDGEPLKWFVDAVDSVTIRPGDAPGELFVTADPVQGELREDRFLPDRVCIVGQGCCVEAFWCDEVPPPRIDPLCPPPEPAHLDLELSNFVASIDDVSVAWDCTITASTPVDAGAAITLACLDAGTPVDPPPVLTITGQPTPDLALLAVDTAVALAYTHFSWGGETLLRVDAGDTVLVAAVLGFELVDQAPFTLDVGEQTCAPVCEGCDEIAYHSTIVTIEDASADLPSETFGQIGPFDVWAGRNGITTLGPWCSDVGSGARQVAVVRRP